MYSFKQLVGTTIGKKFIVGLSGLALVGFAIAHLLGNLTIFAGADAFNAYAHKLHTMKFFGVPLLPFAELGLLAVFLIHIIFTISLTIDNRKARGNDKYKINASKQQGIIPRFSSRMIATGTVVLIFVLVHVGSFRFPLFMRHFEDETLYDIMVRSLTHPLVATFYVLAVLFLGGHLVHGVQSTLRSLGIYHSRITPAVEKVSVGLGFVLAVGFASLPLYLNLIH